MLPSETMIWQPEFTDKTLSRKPGAVHICFGQRANMCFETGLIRRHNLLYNRFAALTPTVTTASLGYTRSVLLVRGTTTTRARFLFAASLLTITAGHVLRISLSTAGSNSIHHVSPVPSLLCHLSNTLLSNTCNKKVIFLQFEHDI
ncbi:hypothetical protein BK306_16020 [Escherichia coli]|nr:hypothetical protein BK254_13640 [Escherichia coli]OJL12401.1 hypothetical protein BK255_03125 [Escherichia coli]OJM32403.1 hypothetical protein BK280_17680 [Escherichia coli]OJN19347.1 hypothetical protein BK298_21935 [Escherichia coli]OJN23556.1 hypothetical protein BK299_24535 [Escherichia coli]